MSCGFDNAEQATESSAIHPKGESLFVAASESQSLVSLRNDRDTGKLQLVQVIRNDEAVVDVLDGAMSVLVDPTGRHIYTLAGRFRGAGAIGVFSYSPESGEITLLEGHKSGSPGLEGFAGGNQLALSPNGSRVYAIGTTSGRLTNPAGHISFVPRRPRRLLRDVGPQRA